MPTTFQQYSENVVEPGLDTKFDMNIGQVGRYFNYMTNSNITFFTLATIHMEEQLLLSNTINYNADLNIRNKIIAKSHEVSVP